MANDWQGLINTTIRKVTPMLIMPTNIYKKFMELQTPEQIAKADARREKERASLAAIEAAKTPAQRLKEKQDACDHEFCNIPEVGVLADPKRPQCSLCGLKVSVSFARGYAAGHEKGYGAGQQSVECDC